MCSWKSRKLVPWLNTPTRIFSFLNNPLISLTSQSVGDVGISFHLILRRGDLWIPRKCCDIQTFSRASSLATCHVISTGQKSAARLAVWSHGLMGPLRSNFKDGDQLGRLGIAHVSLAGAGYRGPVGWAAGIAGRGMNTAGISTPFNYRLFSRLSGFSSWMRSERRLYLIMTPYCPESWPFSFNISPAEWNIEGEVVKVRLGQHEGQGCGCEGSLLVCKMSSLEARCRGGGS